MKVTLDTNILVSGTFWTGDSFKILDMLDKGKLTNVSTKDIINEYYKILVSDEIVEKVKNKKLVMTEVIQKIINNFEIVEPSFKLDVVKEDPYDNKVLECAKEGKVDYIITNDNHLLKLKQFEGIKIVIPAEFLKLLTKNLS